MKLTMTTTVCEVQCCLGKVKLVLCGFAIGVTTRMTGTDNPKTGTVEVMVDGTWGTLCNRYVGFLLTLSPPRF
jgi:hypothetical protein